MQFLVIENVPPWDGRYEFEPPFAVQEWGWIKRLTGYMPLTVEQGFDGGDPELYCAFAAIALHRAGKLEPGEVPDFFARVGKEVFESVIRLEADDEEAEEDASPPAPSSGSSGSTSGDASPPRSASSADGPNHSGSPGSVSLESLPRRSAV